MKTFFSLLAMALLCGCRSPDAAVKREGKGSKWTYAAGRQEIWQAALNACRVGDLRLKSANNTNGLIEAYTPARLESWGEYVAVWVRPLATNATEVEVVSRRVGPSDIFQYNWERPILTSIAVDLNLPTPTWPPKEKAFSPKAGK